MLVYFLIGQGRLDASLRYLSDYLEADGRRYCASLAGDPTAGIPCRAAFAVPMPTTSSR